MESTNLKEALILAGKLFNRKVDAELISDYM